MSSGCVTVGGPASDHRAEAVDSIPPVIEQMPGGICPIAAARWGAARIAFDSAPTKQSPFVCADAIMIGSEL
jgi:hypothetical protein